MNRRVAAWMMALSSALCACEEATAPPRPDTPVPTAAASAALDQPLQPLPAAKRVDPARAALGRRLFSTTNLSADGSVSCATCHPLDRGGADGFVHSRGANGRQTLLNTPTIYNATYNFRFNWNGAFATLEDALDAPIALALGTTWAAVADKLRADPSWRRSFQAAYPEGATTSNIKDALARYIDTLITPDARFDEYLRGDIDALTSDERRGYETFKMLGCACCHQGANVGGNMFQRLGVMHDYFQERVEYGGSQATAADLGRYETTNLPSDRHVFRVPSLRNVALTPPYFHDGSAPTLEQAVARMAYVQLGQHLGAEEIALVVAFLKTLTALPVQAPHRSAGS